MDDRELLELAAKAAGMDVGRAQDGQWFYCEHGQCGEGMYRIDGNFLEFWNARTDDGDALRLAVKVGILIAPPAYNGGWQATASAKADETAWIDDTSGSHEESTRRAIVRAAAEIGKAMK